MYISFCVFLCSVFCTALFCTPAHKLYFRGVITEKMPLVVAKVVSMVGLGLVTWILGKGLFIAVLRIRIRIRIHFSEVWIRILDSYCFVASF